MNTKEILIAARALIDTPEKHTQGVSARNAVGNPVDPKEKQAVCFCPLGAIDRVCYNNHDYFKAYTILRGVVGMVSKFNDTHTHAEVLAMFDEAISRTERGIV